jgi:hypothetical protein
MTGPEPAVPDRESVDDWSLASMTGYLNALDAHAAWAAARTADLRRDAGAGHFEVLSALARAEEYAPAAERPHYAAAVDAYAAEHGLRGWYRHADSHGAHLVQVNKLRTPADGNRGRYYPSAAIRGQVRVVDRDTGVFTTGPVTRQAAEAWITLAEAQPPTAGFGDMDAEHGEPGPRLGSDEYRG